jgi:hypothetical protein
LDLRNRIKLLVVASLSLVSGWFLHSIWEYSKYDIISTWEHYRYTIDIVRRSSFDYYDSFDYFYQQFTADSSFQKAHVRMPLPYREWIMEHHELYKEETWKDWRYIDLPMNLDPMLYDNFDGEMAEGKRLLIYQNTHYYFEFYKTTWYLIRIEKFI